jgi:hypothetical protein
MKLIDKVLALFQWMYTDFILAGPAAMFACVYFAPNHPPKAGLLKRLRSPTDREKAIEGIKNGAWDITHLSDFVRRIDEEPGEHLIRFIFATSDAGLRAIAGIVVSQNTNPEISEIDALAVSLEQWWPVQDARRIAEAWYSYRDLIRDPNWWDQYEGRDYVSEVIAQGETEIRAWRPPS